jgi:hypothetical protein
MLEHMQDDQDEGNFKPAIDVNELVGESPKTVKTEEEYRDVATEDPRVSLLTVEIRQLRSEGKTKRADALVAEVRGLISSICIELKQHDGVYQNPEELEQARQTAVQEIASQMSSDSTDEDVLLAFGLVAGDGTITIENSPLVRIDTQLALDKYLRIVDQFDAASYIEESQGIAVKDIGRVNAERTAAHDLVATMVSRDLGLEFGAARRFVQKIQVEKVPGKDETELYGMAIRQLARKVEGQNGYLEPVVQPLVSGIRRLEEEQRSHH